VAHDSPTPPPPASTTPPAVFRKTSRASWWISTGVHVGIFALLIIGVVTGKLGRAVERIVQYTEFQVARRQRAATPPAPPLPPAPPAPRAAGPARPSPARHAAPAARGGHHSAPRLMTAPAAAGGAAGGGTGFEMFSGDDANWRGGPMGERERARAAPAPRPAPVPAPAPPAVRRAPLAPAPTVLDEDHLAVRPAIRCDPAVVAALYPQAAIDNDVEAEIPVEVIINVEGQIVTVHARNDPGYGLGAVAERAVRSACRVVAIARDQGGNAIAARVVHRIRFELD
jgi:hypothetical protein